MRFSLLALMSLSITSLNAGETLSAAKKEVVQEPSPPRAFSGRLSIAVVSQYFSRGLVFENQGAIAQPALDLSIALHQGEGALRKLSLDLGVWTSFHSRKTDASPRSAVRDWYETDFTAGFSMTFAGALTFTPTWVGYRSPNSGFDPFHGVNLQLALDDSQWLGALALHPHIAYLRELSGKAGSGAREGSYFELGITPQWPKVGPVEISFPMIVGFGAGEFYEGDTAFGYFSGGVNSSVAIGFVPEEFGEWAIDVGVTYYYLNGSLATYNAPNTRSPGHHEVVFSGGLGVAF